MLFIRLENVFLFKEVNQFLIHLGINFLYNLVRNQDRIVFTYLNYIVKLLNVSVKAAMSRSLQYLLTLKSNLC